MIPIYKPYLPKQSLTYAYDAIESGWVSSLGEYKNIASNKLSKMLGIKHALLLANGTVATHLLVKAIKYKYPNANKVLISNNIYIAAYNSLLFDDPEEFKIYPLDANLKTKMIRFITVIYHHFFYYFFFYRYFFYNFLFYMNRNFSNNFFY